MAVLAKTGAKAWPTRKPLPAVQSRMFSPSPMAFPSHGHGLIKNHDEMSPVRTARQNHRGRRRSLDDPSGIWQTPGGPLDVADPGSADSADILVDAGRHHALSSSVVPDMYDKEGPSLDYVPRYPDPTEDDPASPDFLVAAAALAGPDMHGVLEAEVAMVGGGRRGVSVVEQLRQRALAGSSDEEDERWRSMDIPALLLSPHHASALHSLSTTEDDIAAVPDFADLTRAHEADLAARAAAESVPPELRPLARAASLLRYLRGGVPGGAQASGDDAGSRGLALRLPPTRFDGLPPEPLTPQQLQAAVTALAVSNINPTSGIPPASRTGPAAAAASSGSDGDLGSSADVEVDPPGGIGDSEEDTDSDLNLTEPSKRAVAAAAAAMAEEGIEWLSAEHAPKPAAAAAAFAASAGLAAAVARARAAESALRVMLDKTAKTSSSATLPPQTPPPPAEGYSHEAVAAAAAVVAAVGGQAPHATSEAGAGAAARDEARSVQLRRAPHGAGHGPIMDTSLQLQVEEAVAREAAEAEAHVVRHTMSTTAAATAAPPTTAPVGTPATVRVAFGDAPVGAPAAAPSGSGQFAPSHRMASALTADGAAAAAAAAMVEQVAAAGGRAAADRAAAELKAEIRQAVWGEGGWPYGEALRTEDLSDDLKEVIHEQEEEAKWGFDGVLLP